jgi:hypothetical protein
MAAPAIREARGQEPDSRVPDAWHHAGRSDQKPLHGAGGQHARDPTTICSFDHRSDALAD